MSLSFHPSFCPFPLVNVPTTDTSPNHFLPVICRCSAGPRLGLLDYDIRFLLLLRKSCLAVYKQTRHHPLLPQRLILRKKRAFTSAGLRRYWKRYCRREKWGKWRQLYRTVLPEASKVYISCLSFDSTFSRVCGG